MVAGINFLNEIGMIMMESWSKAKPIFTKKYRYLNNITEKYLIARGVLVGCSL